MKDKLQLLIGGVLPYLIFCSGVYHVTFWYHFKANLFTLFSVNELLLGFVKPFAFCVLGAMISIPLFYSKANQLRNQESPLSSEGSTPLIRAVFIAKKAKFDLFIVMSVLGIIGCLYWYGSYPSEIVSGIVYLLIWILTSVLIFVFNIRVSLDNHSMNRFVFMSILGLLPSFAILQGMRDSSRILYNTKGVEYYRPSSDLKGIPEPELKFVSALSDRYIFTTIDNNKVYVISADQIPVLQLSADSTLR